MKDILNIIVVGGLFIVLFLPMHVAESLFFPFITGKNFDFRIIVEIVFAAWILLCLYDAQYRPKFSWILASLASLLVVMLFANAFGEYPHKSFWSNFERMDGYVTLVHLCMYVLVLGSVMVHKKTWILFFNISVGVATYVALFGIAQISGLVEAGNSRIESTLGNAAYVAVYMLFHLFIIAWLFLQSKNTFVRFLYLVVAGIFVYVLLQTGTRGTFLGLAGGAVVGVGYVALFGARYPALRKLAIGGCIALLLAGAGFFAVKDTDFVQNQGSLARIANISLSEDLAIRTTIWSMALEGVKERPLLGWGQENFNYVFNKKFNPSLYAVEPWYDRTHNVFLDWMIAGGVLGLLAYLSIFGALLYYLIYLPFFKNDERLDVLERAVLLGLVSGYFVHNLVVFDNIISYIFFGTILAFVHIKVAKPIAKVQAYNPDRKVIANICVPVVIVSAVLVIYIVNIPAIGAASDIITGMGSPKIIAGKVVAPTPTERLEAFTTALDRNSFADQEIVEQLTQYAITISRNSEIPLSQREAVAQKAEESLQALIAQKPGDTRLHDYFADFYKSIGNYTKAQEQAALARQFSPNKQGVIINQGIIELLLENKEASKEYFKIAYELDTSNANAAVYYAALLVQLDDVATAREVLGEEFIDAFAQSDFASSVVYESGNTDFLLELLQLRLEQSPEDIQNYINLSFLYYEVGQTESSIAVLEKALETHSEYATQMECFIGNMKKGNVPQEGCT